MPDGELKALEIQWPAGVPKTCSQGMLVTAVRMWARFASNLEIAQFLNIPVHAVPAYTSSLWWADLVKQLRPILDHDIEHSFGRIGSRALSQLEDRLTYGDFYITRNGERARRPLDAKTLAQIAALAVDRRQQARALVDGTAADANADDRPVLTLLAEMLRAAARQNQAVSRVQVGGQTIDVAPIEEALPSPKPVHAPADAPSFG